MLEARQLSYSVPNPAHGEGERRSVLRALDLQLSPGQFLGLVGANGSGKSSLARLLNGLARPQSGQVIVDGFDAAQPEQRHEVLARVGMVFQNPESQFVATVVEEDVAFGPENLGLSRVEIDERIRWALQAVGISHLRHHSPQRLSGGQKQRVAIACALALRPRYLILDEPTSMLDPGGRRDFLTCLDELRQSAELGILMITHRLEELERSDGLIFLEHGQIAAQLTFSELAQERQRLAASGVALPPRLELQFQLGEHFPDWENLPLSPLTPPITSPTPITSPAPPITSPAPIIVIEQLSRIYGLGAPWQHQALHDITATLQKGESLGLMGATGSGKSTLVQHFNGLMRPQSGRVRVGERPIPSSGGELGWLRRKVGLLFQNPEQQFFEETVRAEIAFGPRNFGLPVTEQLILESLQAVGLSSDYLERSPHELSGGEKRCVALASILAFGPEILILDEPTAGLDANHRRSVLTHLKTWQQRCNGTLIVISHEFEDLAELVDRCWWLEQGQLRLDGNLRQLLPELSRHGVPLPWLSQQLLNRPTPPPSTPILVSEFLARCLLPQK